MLIVEAIDLLCGPCSGVSPNYGGSAAGGAGAAAASQDASSGPPRTDSPTPSDLTAPGLATDIGTGLATDAALSAAAGTSAGTGAAATMLGALAAAVSGSQSLAEGLTTIFRNDGRGLGGSSNAGRSGMQEAMDHIQGQRSDGTRLK